MICASEFKLEPVSTLDVFGDVPVNSNIWLVYSIILAKYYNRSSLIFANCYVQPSFSLVKHDGKKAMSTDRARIYKKCISKRCLTFADCRLQTADCRLQTADCGLRTADYRLQTAYNGPQTVDNKRRWLTAGHKSWRPQSLNRHNPSVVVLKLWRSDHVKVCVDSVTLKYRRRWRWPRKLYCILDSIVSP